MGSNVIASGSQSTAIGLGATASGHQSVALGIDTTASGNRALAFGDRTSATGPDAIAMGLRATAAGHASVVLGSDAGTTAAAFGSFVYGDRSTSNDVISELPNQFLVRAAGGTVFWSTSDTTFNSGPGVVLFAGAGAWAALSDVNAKQNFRDLNGDDVLTKIARLPIREWNYKAQAAVIRHVGPTAQDFHAAFGLGEDERRISTVDADGIALRAIQALVARTRATNERLAEIDVLRAELAALRAELAALREARR